MFYIPSSPVSTFTLLTPIYHFFPAENLAESGFFFSLLPRDVCKCALLSREFKIQRPSLPVGLLLPGPHSHLQTHRAPRITGTEHLQQILYSASSLGTVSPAWLCPSPRSTGRERDVPAANASALAWRSAFSLSSSFKPQFLTVPKRSDLALR